MNNSDRICNKHPVRRKLNVLFAHASLVMGIFVFVCFVLEKVNDSVSFMTGEVAEWFMASGIAKWFIGIGALLAIMTAILTIINLWKKP
ncbi:MAG: hypothetical protein KIG25_02265 [Eubacteriales bacterium]|nr:hypothetical protein [Eubacteriales bacterium]MDD6018053.1 hypothetical protein [Clostridiales bacterium]